MKYEKTNEEWDAKTSFITYFDGGYGIEPMVQGLSTYYMGVTDLHFDVDNNTLTVELRCPGLLIGKGGSTIDTAMKHLGYTINVREKILVLRRPDSKNLPSEFDYEEEY